MRSFWHILACLLVIGSIGAAQEPVSISLDKAVSIAMQKNTSVIQAQNNLEAQQSQSTAAVGNLFPSLDASGSFYRQQNWSPERQGSVTYLNGIPISLPGSGGYNAINSYSAGLSSRLTLFNGFANTAGVTRAQSNAQASEYTLNRTEQSTVNQTYQLFLNVFRDYQLLKVNEDNLKRDQQQLERIQESNKVGALAIADVYRQQVQVGNDQIAQIQAQNSYENAKADLIAFLGVDFNNQYSFDFTGIPTDIDTTEFTRVNQQYADFNSLITTATSSRPDYLAAVETRNSASSSVTVAKSGYYPTVAAQASYGYTNPELGSITDNRNLNLSLQVSLPIFNGFATQSQIQQAQSQENNATEQLAQARRQVVVDVRKALLDLESAEKQISVAQTTVTSAQMDRQIAEEKYNLGAGTLLDLLTAVANYTIAENNKINAVTGYLLAKKNMEYAIGTLSK